MKRRRNGWRRRRREYKLQFIGEFAAVGRALTKTFIHSPFMGANPIGFK
jgi:hypothetical protein